MDPDQADQAAGLIQRQARSRRRRQQYAATLQRLSTITIDNLEDHTLHRIQQWARVLSVNDHPCRRSDVRPILNKYAFCHRNKHGDQLYYQYPAELSNVAEVVGHELHRCRQLHGIAGLILPYDEVAQLDDQLVVTIETSAQSRPLLEHIASLPAGVYNEHYVRGMMTSLVRIVEEMHERDQVCGHLLPSKLYHDGHTVKLMAFGLGKYMPIVDQQLLIPELDGFMAPEVLHDHGAYRPWSDCYAIGALLHLFLTGNFITSDDDLATISDEAHDLMGCLLDPRPFYRLRSSEIMQHRWFAVAREYPQDHDWIRIQANLSQLVSQAAMNDRVLRRFLSGDGRQVMSRQFCHLLDYGSFPGFGQPLIDTSEIANALQQAIESLSSAYISKSDQERAELDPLSFVAGVLKDIASSGIAARRQARAHPSRFERTPSTIMDEPSTVQIPGLQSCQKENDDRPDIIMKKIIMEKEEESPSTEGDRGLRQQEQSGET